MAVSLTQFACSFFTPKLAPSFFKIITMNTQNIQINHDTFVLLIVYKPLHVVTGLTVLSLTQFVCSFFTPKLAPSFFKITSMETQNIQINLEIFCIIVRL